MKRPAPTVMAAGALFLAWSALACSEGSPPSTPTKSPSTRSSAPAPPEPAGEARTPAPAEEPADLVAEGRDAYLGNCIACHNPDPRQDGALGPAVWGSSQELLEARIMRAEYPPGYEPKRETAAMIAMPFLEGRIPALAAYLAGDGS